MAMEENRVLANNVNMCESEASDLKVEEDEDDFKSCCEDEDELKEKEEHVKVNSDENVVKMYFKGVSITCPGDSGSSISGIGVVMEWLGCTTPVQVQKKLDFYVEELVAEYLALLDGFSEAIQHKPRHVVAFTDSEILHTQIVHDKVVESPLLVALRQRIVEQTSNFETFALKLVPTSDLHKALSLAQVAVGIVSTRGEGEESTESCSICFEEKLSSMMLSFKCSHKFCSHCMKTYVEGKVHSTQVPIRCPQLGCKYCISATECSLFLPVTSYESLERALAEANVLSSKKIYCPYPSCSVLLDPHDCLSTRASSSSQSDNSCVECPVCQGFICVDCEVQWHSSMTCEEYQSLPLEERDASDLTLHRLAQNKRWRRCVQCRRMIELTHGCYHMTCWCGHEFCYSCGVDYRAGQQTCECAFWNDDYSEEMAAYPTQQLEQWAGGFSLNDQNPYQSPPLQCTDSSSYADAMKDLHQLPWLERFVSVISDNYYQDYIQ
ncbi:E3 ubiquitin-protein ligase RSL1 [Salvia miltiorrhiza]|uniref:E3 ubiquitin-protein ligase RSL1 n=1 Tax=Salvia miltiorrhiza TaxID=226208 RepID=UPI0025AB7BF5|nr:E3 ubiquitin-protein ligase RSL1 [Salvia miltiorrhiza]XP_057812105.1 E3 ubiquitin-protein ligase RSL1 [Salvia miltiorrhiza]